VIVSVAIATVVVLAYALVGRTALKRLPHAAPLFEKIEPVERALWRKSETILWARFQQFIGLLTTLLSLVGIIDLSPYMVFVPERHRYWVQAVPPMAVSLNGLITEILRRSTSKPLQEVEKPDPR